MNAVSNFVRFLARIIQFAVVAIVFLSIAAPVGYGVHLYVDETYRTFGSVHVDSPTVYTRERLVNDRFVEDAWLRSQLEHSNSQVFGPDFTFEHKKERHFGSQLSPVVGDLQNTTTVKPMTMASNTSKQANPNVLSASDRLSAELHFREQIRNLIIENQLDDRHDLKGNTLYRLKFPATVVPGNRTRSYAWVEVRVASPQLRTVDSQISMLSKLSDLPREEAASWEELYNGWLNSVESRLNQARTELLRSYNEMSFSSSYYDDFIRHIHRNPALSDLTDKEEKDLADARHQLDFGKPDEARRAHRVYQDVINAVFARQRIPHQAAAKPSSGSLLATPSEGDHRPGYSLATVELELEKFIEKKIYELVLGRQITSLYSVPGAGATKLLNFALITRESPNFGRFSVLPNIWKVNIMPAPQLDIPSVSLKIEGEQLLVNAGQLHSITNNGFGIEFNRRVDVEGLGSWFDVPVGLLSFIRALGQREEVYTYSVTPREAAQRVATNNSREQESKVETTGSIDALGVRALLGLNERDSQRLIGVVSQPTVVGFGQHSTRGRANFGWVIGPQLDEWGRMRHVPRQHQLTALVSLPSWWNSVSLKIGTRWLDDSGNLTAHQDGENSTITYPVELPVDYEALESVLLGSERSGPEVVESRVERIVLSVCQEASILIPGRRLWRSSVVTLGGQRADSIAVLPDMKGIIARFRQIERPPGWTNLEQEYYAPVTIWTSQGNVTLTQRARILASPAVAEYMKQSVGCAPILPPPK